MTTPEKRITPGGQTEGDLSVIAGDTSSVTDPADLDPQKWPKTWAEAIAAYDRHQAGEVR